MTEPELRQLLAEHEADRIELTTATSDTKNYSEAVCSFANDLPGHRAPGYLIIGVDDRRRVTGMRISDELLRNLGRLRDDGNIQPLPSLTVERVSTTDGEVAVVTVQPSLLPPVRYQGRICIRTGPRRGYAGEQDEHILIERRVAFARTFDAQPCLGGELEDMDRSLFLNDYRRQALAPEIIEENNRTLEQQLASLRFFDLKHGCPTHAGILLFGLDVRNWLPGAYVLSLRIAGTSLTEDVLAEHVISGDLLHVLRELTYLTDVLITSYPVQETALRERLVVSYPKLALRELIMNAIMHRDYASTAPLRITWYEDRVEIQSPGGLYGTASEENVPYQTSYRNPVMAEALKALGFVNQ